MSWNFGVHGYNKREMSKSQVVILGVVGFIVIFFFSVVFLGVGRKAPIEKAELTVWGVENEEVFSAAFSKFNNENKGVRVDYEEIPEASYEKRLIDALAAGAGPDVFMFRSNWLSEHRNKIVPVPEAIFPSSRLEDIYPRVVEEDFVSGNNIYALPLYIDTLSLVYNREAFDKKGVPLPPKTWAELETMAARKRLSVSLGEPSPVVTRAKEILMAMMLQSGVTVSPGVPARLSVPGGVKALEYYAQFIPSKNDSIADFAGEKTDVIFDFYSSKELIRAKNPFLKFAFASLPQFDAVSPVTVASYYGLAVSNKASRPDLAWKLIVTAAADEEVAENYLQVADHPPALRTLIAKYSDSRDYGVFARQALTARSWPEPEVKEMTRIFNEMISYALDKENISDALRRAEGEINQLYR